MATPRPPRERWYRQPILWLGAALFAAILAGCVWLIVVAQRHADPPVATGGEVFKVPLSPTASEDAPQ